MGSSRQCNGGSPNGLESWIRTAKQVDVMELRSGGPRGGVWREPEDASLSSNFTDRFD